MKHSIIFTLLMLICNIISAQYSNAEILSDIEVLGKLIAEKHVSPYWLNTKENIDSVIRSARNAIASKPNCDESCLVEIMKIIAALKDGHSTMDGSARYEEFGYLPISLRWFDGELRVIRTIEKHKPILGYKVTAINSIPISEVLEKVSQVVPQANKYRFHKFAGSYVHLPGLLFGLGITDDAQKAHFTFESRSEKLDIWLNNLTEEEEENQKFVSYLDDKKETDLYQRNNADYYWFDYNNKNEIFYFQYNRVGNMEEEGSTAFAKRMWKTVDSLEIGKFVLDLRYNGGGNFPYSIRFIQGILDRLDINRSGRLFIITGYDTFSAAMDMLNELELKSKAIIVGEYPCDHPSRPGDPEEYKLPNTGIEVYLSSLYHPTAIPNDPRETSSLDVEIITTWKDYASGKDPVMEYIRDYKKPEREAISSDAFKQSIGSYNFNSIRDIIVKDVNGELWLEISKALETPIYQNKDGKLITELPDLTVELAKNVLVLHYPGQEEAVRYKKLGPIRKSAVDYLYDGNVKTSKEIYLQTKASNPDQIDLKDHMICFLANMVYFDLLKYSDVDAAGIATEILQMGIELNEGKAPFCKFTLRFYQ